MKDLEKGSYLAMHECGHPLLCGRQGSALIITLLVVAILSGLVVEFAREVYIGTSALSNWTSAQKASLMAQSGQTLGSSFVSSISTASYTYPGEIVFPVEQEPGNGAFLLVRIEDESAKFDINSVVYPNGLTNEEALLSLKKLLEYLEINPDLALSVADWIDPDHEPRRRNSEFGVKNAPIVSVQELKNVEGFDLKAIEKLSPFITVYSSGSRININTAQLPVLVSMHKDMTEALAQKVIDYRENSPFESTASVQNVSGMETIGVQIISRIAVKSSFFRIMSTATVNGITRVIESVLDGTARVAFWRET